MQNQNKTRLELPPLLTPWIFFPVTGHLGPLALFLVYWYTSLPPARIRRSHQHHQEHTHRSGHHRLLPNLAGMKPRGARTWGLDDPGLVGLGRVAVTLSVGEALHHLAAADKTLVMLGAGARGWGRKGGGRGKGSRRRRYGYKYLARAATRSGRLGLIRLIWRLDGLGFGRLVSISSRRFLLGLVG